ncbi:MAG: 50S ribosomal protein L9 [Nitrospirota bacterium]
MKVILKSDVNNVGKMGEIVNVSDGYARNYLVPKGLAVEANTKNIKLVDHQKRMILEKAKKVRNVAQEMSNKISSMTLLIKANAGEEGRLFGSVTTMDIAELLKKEGVEIDKKKITLDEPIKRLGTYSVNIKLHSDISTQVALQVVQE